METDRTLVVAADSGVPVYEQIAGQIRGRIADGELPPGQVLPPVRTLASDLGVNLNTVARAYRLLERQGFVRIRDRAGVEVAAPPARPDAAARDRLAAELREVVVRMRQAGIGAAEIARIAEAAIAPTGPRGE